MKTLALETKYYIIQDAKDGKPINHPIFVRKSIWQQIWEIAKPWLIWIIGIVMGYYIG